MLVKAQTLRELGATNVVALDRPVTMVNGGVASARSLEYKSLDEIRLTEWFQDANAGALLIVFDSGSDESDNYVVRLFDFSHWFMPSDAGEFSALSLHRARERGSMTKPS